MKKGVLVLYCFILFIVALIANIVVTIFLVDHNNVMNIVTTTVCMLFFAFVFFLLLFKIKSNRNVYIVFLMLLFPCIFYDNITDGFDPWRLNSDSGFKVGLGGFLWSIIKGIFAPLYNKSPNSFQHFSISNSLVIYSLYSMLLTGIIGWGLIQIKRIGFDYNLYVKSKYFILLALIFVTIILVIFERSEKIYYYEIDLQPFIYICSYFLILYIFFKIKGKWKAKWFYSYFLLCFLFLFPVISVSSNIVNTITADYTPYYDRAIAIKPIISALPTTIFYLFKDSLVREMGGLNGLYSVKLYTLLQIFLVVVIFPPVLTHKIDKTG